MQFESEWVHKMFCHFYNTYKGEQLLLLPVCFTGEWSFYKKGLILEEFAPLEANSSSKS